MSHRSFIVAQVVLSTIALAKEDDLGPTSVTSVTVKQRKGRRSSALQILPVWFLAQGNDIRDIRNPIHIPYPWLWAVYMLLGLAVIALLVWIYQMWTKKSQKVHIKLPHEIAFERLEAAKVLMRDNKVKEFSVNVSDAVRNYIEQRFQVAAAHKTTEEFLYKLLGDSASPLAPYSKSLEEFLKHCDLAKFARWSLSQEEMQSMYESAHRLVQGTIPQVQGQGSHKPIQNHRQSPPLITTR
jgi:hypothetical protein